MQLKDIALITNEDEARQIAIDWQGFASVKSLSYSELAKFQEYFNSLAKKFNLEEEFSENGIV